VHAHTRGCVCTWLCVFVDVRVRGYLWVCVRVGVNVCWCARGVHVRGYVCACLMAGDGF